LRADLEHHPRDPGHGLPPEGRDPFEVDPEQALEALRLEWGHSHLLTWDEGLYRAQRIGPGGKPYGLVLTGPTPDEIEQELRRDWGET
jgi:hypothetical protein